MNHATTMAGPPQQSARARRKDVAIGVGLGVGLAGFVLLLAHFGLERAGRAILDTDTDPRLQVDAPRGYAGTTREARRAAVRALSEVEVGLNLARHHQLVSELTFEVNAAAIDIDEEQRELGSWTALLEAQQAFVEADKAWNEKVEKADDAAGEAAEEKLQASWAKAREAFERSERQLRSAY